MGNSLSDTSFDITYDTSFNMKDFKAYKKINCYFRDPTNTFKYKYETIGHLTIPEGASIVRPSRENIISPKIYRCDTYRVDKIDFIDDRGDTKYICTSIYDPNFEYKEGETYHSQLETKDKHQGKGLYFYKTENEAKNH
jgi:hypothetical protein